MPVELSVDTRELDRVVEHLREAPRIVRQVARTVLEREMDLAEQAANRNVRKGGASGLQVRSGRLLGYISHAVQEDAQGVLGRLGILSGPELAKVLVYAGVQEYGSRGPIRPKRGKLLTIPLAEALTPTGQPKFTAADVRKGGAAAGKYPGGTFWRSIGGALLGGGIPILFGRRGKTDRSKPIPLFVGVKSVTIPARPYLRPAMESRLPAVREGLERGLIAALLEQRGA